MAAALLPGWWWYHVELADKPQVLAFSAANPGRMLIRKTFASPGTASEIIVFEVVGAPLVWTLKGWPTQAKKGIKTELRDIAKTAGSSPSASLQAALEELLGKPWEAIKDTAGSANLAAKVLIWGGAAILLINLYRWTEAPEESD